MAASDVPTVAQVARIYPAYKNGSRELRSDRGNGGEQGVEKCTDWTSGFRSATGKSALYFDKRDEMLQSGLDDAAVSVYQFSTKANAKKVEGVFTSFVRECEGFHLPNTSDEAIREFRAEVVPRGYFGLRTKENEPTLDEVGGGEILDEQESIEIVTIKGRFVIHVRTVNDEASPSTAKCIRLAKLARAMAG